MKIQTPGQGEIPILVRPIDCRSDGGIDREPSHPVTENTKALSGSRFVRNSSLKQIDQLYQRSGFAQPDRPEALFKPGQNS